MKNRLKAFILTEILVATVMLLAGCSDSPQEVQQKLSTPKFVGITEDGLLVKRYSINVDGATHYIYVLSTNATVSINHRENKTDRVEVIVNGTKYISPELP